jgi:uncharacterized protein YgiM (DUF1202 family)
MPNSPISFHGNAVPDGIMAGSRKRKQTFSMNDPDNVELARLATQAAKKKAKLRVIHQKKGTVAANQKKSGQKNSGCQPSVEEEINIFPPPRGGIPRNPRNIIESSDDDDEAATRPTTKAKKNLNDPDNVELAHLTTQAAKKKAKLSKVSNSSEKRDRDC